MGMHHQSVREHDRKVREKQRTSVIVTQKVRENHITSVDGGFKDMNNVYDSEFMGRK